MSSRRLFVAMLLLCLAPVSARAQQFDYGSVRLLQTGERSGALFFSLNPSWKISWRKNTVNVFPTELSWRSNASSFLWPFPQTFDLFGAQSYGYEGRAALPFTTRSPFEAGERVAVSFAACAQVCLPIETTLTTELAGEQERRLIASLLRQVPQEAAQGSRREAGLRLTYLPVASPTEEGEGGGGELTLTGEEEQSVLLQGTWSSEQPLRNPRLIVERAAAEQGGLFALTSLKGKGSRKLRFAAEGRFARDASATSVRVTLAADNLSPVAVLATAELARSPYESSASSASSTQSSTHLEAQAASSLLPSSASMLGLVVLAFLGGLVLNAMPCVFPVLAIKITSLARADDADRKERQTTNKTSSKLQRALLANALGMMLAFLLLAFVLVLAKSGGEKLGWGFQFHWPVFNGSIAALLLLLACDGWRIVSLPFPAYSEKAPAKIPFKKSSKKFRKTFLNEETTSRRKEWGSECATGMLMTWLATPCAAPILGSALSAAVVQRAPVVFLMFALMGAGMATPLLLAAVCPRRVAKILPPPGAWSEILRKILALAILAASLWLFSIFAKQLSLTAASILAATTLLVVLALRKKQQADARGVPRRAFASVRLALLLTSPVLVAVLLNILPNENTQQQKLEKQKLGVSPSQETAALVWQPFAPERIPAFLASDNLVVVNVTADWCLSCKVIEQRVYKTAAVRARLTRLPVVLMRADWTSHDARIAAFLREHRRYAIPFTALFAPAGEVLLLPEMYGQKTFLDALAYAETLRAQTTRAQTTRAQTGDSTGDQASKP